MPHISNELWEELKKHRIILRDEFKVTEKDPDGKWVEDWVKWEKNYNVKWTNWNGHTTNTERWCLNPLVPRFPISLRLEEVAIRQGEGAQLTRKHVDLTTELCRGITIEVPLIPANMKTVSNVGLITIMDKCHGVGILHRAWKTTEEYLSQVKQLKESSCLYRCASVGLGLEQLELAKTLIRNGINVIVIDISHGFTEEIKLMCLAIRRFHKDTKLIVGNVVNAHAIEYYADCADAVKVGISNGAACRTKHKTGVIENQFTAVERCGTRAKELGMPIIADGGIRSEEDFVKVIGAGASTAMAGMIFAQTDESDAPLVNGKKVFSGMASKATKETWTGDTSHCEGTTIELEPSGPVSNVLDNYCEALKSAISYTNSSNIKEFQSKVKFVLAKRCED